MTKTLRELVSSGIRIKVPGAVQSLSASSQIIANSEIILLSSTLPVTLNSAPTISDGANGQFILLINVGSSNITLLNQGPLANSNLRLTANTLQLTPRDSVGLLFLSAIGDWVQVSNLVAVL